jgi:hypothetical protein
MLVIPILDLAKAPGLRIVRTLHKRVCVLRQIVKRIWAPGIFPEMVQRT